MTIPEPLQPFIIDTPNDPARVFSGVEMIFLRFADQAEQEAAFVAAGIVAPPGFELPPDYHWPGIGDISIIGTIYNDDAVRGLDDENGMPTFTPPTVKPGWHVNVLPAA